MQSINNKNIGSYLAGLIEGDGTIFVPKVYRNKKNKINYPYIKICFDIKDKPLALKLNTIFEGNLQENKLKTFIIWIIYKIDILVIIIKIIGPFFRTLKIKKLNSLIAYLYVYFLHIQSVKKMNKIFYFLDRSNIDSNAWLSGFSDADGNFNINISSRKKTRNKRVIISFRLELKKDETYFLICNKIANYFCVSIYNRERIINKNIYFSYLIVAHSMLSQEKVCLYFDKYPLFSSKYLNYLDWKKIYLLQKIQKINENINICINIKNNFNNKRKNFNWEHLKYFYIN